MVKTTVPIKGMHCKACEIVVSDRLLELPQVEEVSVDQRKGEAIITSTQSISTSKIASAVRKAGYQVGKESKQPWLSTDIRDYVIITAMVACVIAGYFSLQTIHWNGFGSSTDFASLPVVFFLGVIAGLSTCAALVGGLVVSAAAKYAVDHPMATALDKIKPHLLFNTGRIGGFALLGGVIGSLGSLVQLSLGTTAFVTVLVGLVMLILGLQLTRISPRLAGYSLAFPARFAQLLHLDTHKKREYGHFHTLLLGVLTFFLPCGFTQTVQLYAAGTGHPFQSALIMGVFALGTTPGLLTLGGVVAVVKGTFAELFFRFVGVIVAVMAVVNITNGLRLGGVSATLQGFFHQSGTVTAGAPVQVLKTTYTLASDILPNKFTVTSGQPVRMEVNVQDNGSGCMGSFTIPGLSNKVSNLVKGQTLVYEFTPSKPGTYEITCAMGVPRGSITVL